MSSQASFVVVICHGSYHTPEPYQPFIEALKVAGIEAYCPQLPSSDLTKLNVGDINNPDFGREPPPGGYPQAAEDVKTVQSLLRKLVVDEKKNVILLGHSSGGFTVTGAAVPEFQAKERKVKGEKGGIIGLFYACAFMVPVGESVHSFFQPKDGSSPVLPPYCKIHKYGMTGLLSTNEGERYFLNGLDDDLAKKYASGFTASTVFTTVLENDAYAALPCKYLVTENDLALPAAYQEGMVALQNMREGVEIGIVKCPSGHSPQLTWTDGLVREVKKFGKELIG
ncbi:Alpha/beta hydrolase fold-1 [Halenospora varia]|nr:Alpha/beta hydrolase fold-1 [Halenospora varia]